MEIELAYRGFNEAMLIQKEALANVEEENMKVERNLYVLEKAGFSRNVFFIHPLTSISLTCTLLHVLSCIRRN